MAEAELHEAVAGSAPLDIDPFSFFVGVASRVSGLGGNSPGYDPYYVFHTPYVEAAEGSANFIIRFHGLTARRGTLQLRVHMLPLEEGARARLINSERIALNRLVQMGGEVSIGFEGFHGVSFAVYGGIEDDTDAEAAALTVTLDRPMTAHAREAAAAVAEARSTHYGRETARPSAQLVAITPPSLAAPVSQMATVPQLREKVAAEWRKQLPPGDDQLATWRDIYVLQALTRYGMLTEGAHGLGLGVEGSPIPALIGQRGVSVTGTVLPNEGGETDAFVPVGQVREVAPGPLPRDLVNFDFLWSAGYCERLGTVEAGIAAVLDSLACLRPGGMAVHALAFDLHNVQPVRREAEMALFQRRHVERLALTVISRGHEAAQIRVASAQPLSTHSGGLEIGMFGLILRRARLPD